MQYSYIPLLKKADKLPLGFILKCFVLIVIISYLYYEIEKQQDLLHKLIINLGNIFNKKSALLLFIPLLLVAFNWAAEAIKWQILSRKIVHQNFIQSFIGVLSGLSLGFITPQSIGEYAGRIWQIKNKRRSELIGAIFLGSLVQSMVSLFFGIWGLSTFIYNQKLVFQVAFNDVVAILMIFFIVTVLLLIFLNYLKDFLPDFIILLYQKYISIISTYSMRELINIAALSFIRYVIFTVQFVFVLVWFEVNLPYHILFAGVSWIFAAKTIIPAFNFLSDIGVREFSAILFFNHYQVDITIIIIASLFIWFINIFIPTMVGSLLVFRLRFFKK